MSVCQFVSLSVCPLKNFANFNRTIIKNIPFCRTLKVIGANAFIFLKFPTVPEIFRSEVGKIYMLIIACFTSSHIKCESYRG